MAERSGPGAAASSEPAPLPAAPGRPAAAGATEPGGAAPAGEKPMPGTLARFIRLLQLVAELGAFSLKDIAARLELPPSSVHRLLQLLVEQDLIERGAHQTYRIGREYFRIGALAARQFELKDAARSHLDAINAAFGETCSFALYLPAERRGMIVDTVATRHALRHHIDPFVPWPLLWGALGRTMLAHLGDAVVARVLAEAAPSPARNDPPPAPAALAAELAAIRAQGYYVSTDQNVLGATGTAAPILAAGGRLIGSLGLTVPLARYRPDQQPALTAAITGQARALSAALGHGAGGAAPAGLAAQPDPQ